MNNSVAHLHSLSSFKFILFYAKTFLQNERVIYISQSTFQLSDASLVFFFSLWNPILMQTCAMPYLNVVAELCQRSSGFDGIASDA